VLLWQPFFPLVPEWQRSTQKGSLWIAFCFYSQAKGLSIACLAPIRVLLSSFAGGYALVMEVFPVFGQIERKHARKDERIILTGSNIDAIGLRQAEPAL
jgi:hypothetical protein